MIRLDSAPTPRARLFLIPLLDVLCFLIAVFVLFTLSMNREHFPSRVRVPTAETGSHHGHWSQVTVVVAEDGTCWLTNLTPRGRSDELLAILAGTRLSKPTLRVYGIEKENPRIEGTPPQLVAVLASFRSFDPNLQVTVAADERVPFAKVAPLLDGLARENITRVAVETRRAPSAL